MGPKSKTSSSWVKLLHEPAYRPEIRTLRKSN
jgi:hypothetical protein